MWTPAHNLSLEFLATSDFLAVTLTCSYSSETTLVMTVIITKISGHRASKNMVKFVINWNVPSNVRAVWQDRLIGWAFERLPGAFSQLTAAGQRLLLAVALFASTSTTVAAEGRGFLTPTHIFRVGPGIQICDLLFRTCLVSVFICNKWHSAATNVWSFEWVCCNTIDCTCSKALLPAEGTTPGIHQVPKVPPACRSLIQRQFHGFGYPTNIFRERQTQKQSDYFTLMNTKPLA